MKTMNVGKKIYAYNKYMYGISKFTYFCINFIFDLPAALLVIPRFSHEARTEMMLTSVRFYDGWENRLGLWNNLYKVIDCVLLLPTLLGSSASYIQM